MNFSIPLVLAVLSYFEPQTSTTHRFKRDVVQPLEFTQLIEALSYGDNCSYVVEEMREKFAKSILAEKLDESAVILKFNKFQSDITKRGLPLCSTDKFVICDKISAKCVCGDLGRSSFLGENHPSGHASKFVPNLKTGSCRWGEGTACVPKEDDPTRTDFCTLRTHCANTKTGNPCQPSDHINEYISRGTNNGIKATFSGEICSCQRDDKPKAPYEQGSDSKHKSDNKLGKSQAVCTNRDCGRVLVTIFATLAILSLMLDI
ncbi:uncharacterized protein LOC110857155 [Folsomia candida]|uniref:uncharacterized protein LOC110857155 n=1 Tax=Folsomia candida TaxID=158441 RepID=UPI000B8F9052|nr:uncharacterized protein LOC110857155 [Folsomia candida]